MTISRRRRSFEPEEVERARPDLFNPGYFSVFDILLCLHPGEGIHLEYRFDGDANAFIIDRIDGQPNWCYQIYYSVGWPERSIFSPDRSLAE